MFLIDCKVYFNGDVIKLEKTSNTESWNTAKSSAKRLRVAMWNKYPAAECLIVGIKYVSNKVIK